ncbi:MAG: hypothetical protein KU38_09475 [Sulfurovum sp. FS08-3]|nr:MAG: hypothetical protein KU38_09475 [Sulfurovum sp. FS08-3]
MLTVGIGEIQKNTAIFAHLTQAIEIVDKHKKELLAIVYPAQQLGIIDLLAGKYQDRIPKTTLSIDEIKAIAMKEAMEEKYGLSC